MKAFSNYADPADTSGWDDVVIVFADSLEAALSLCSDYGLRLVLSDLVEVSVPGVFFQPGADPVED